MGACLEGSIVLLANQNKCHRQTNIPLAKKTYPSQSPQVWGDIPVPCFKQIPLAIGANPPLMLIRNFRVLGETSKPHRSNKKLQLLNCCETTSTVQI